MNVVFWMDDPTTFNPNKDTTYCLIHECLSRNHTVYYASKSSLTIVNNSLECAAIPIEKFQFGSQITLQNKSVILTNRSIDAMWLRCDPPVDHNYYTQMLLLNQFSNDILMLNHPLGILANNEKLSILQFPDIIPETLVSNNKNTILNFCQNFREVIVKPIDGFGGAGIFKYKPSDTNLEPTIETLTANETNHIMIQKALNHSNGDKRILLLNAEPIGAVLRQSTDSHRNNFMAGGIPIKASVTESDHQIIDQIRPFLLANKLYFVGIDIIDNYLIEINVTSPTCMQEINTLNNLKLENSIISFIENKMSVNH